MKNHNLKFKILLPLFAVLLLGVPTVAWGVLPDYPGNVTPVPVPALPPPIAGQGGFWATLGCLALGICKGAAYAFTATGLILGIIDLGLWIVGFLAVLFVIIGGFRYITAHGNEEQAEAAKKTITQAIIGVVVVILSFVIIRVISNALLLGTPGT